MAAGYHIVGDYAVGEHLDNNPLVNLTQLPMGSLEAGTGWGSCCGWLWRPEESSGLVVDTIGYLMILMSRAVFLVIYSIAD